MRSVFAFASALFAFVFFSGRVPAGEEASASAVAGGWGAFLGEAFRSVDVVGFVLATLFIVLLGMIIDMFGHLRISRMIPEALLAEVQEEMTNGEYEKALEMSDKADCLIGQVFAAGLSKTDYSFDRMEDAVRGEVRIQGLVMRQWVSQFRVTAAVGVLLGLAGAALEAMRFVHGLAGRADVWAELAASAEMRGPAHGLFFALLMGTAMALLSLVVSAVASARLEKILLEAERLGGELLDPFRPLPADGEE